MLVTLNVAWRHCRKSGVVGNRLSGSLNKGAVRKYWRRRWRSGLRIEMMKLWRRYVERR